MTANHRLKKERAEALVGETKMVNGAVATVFFLDEYANQLSTAMTNGAGPIAKASIRARLNAAIVVSRIADVGPSWRLAPVISTFLAAGQPDAVTMWGLRAAKPVVLNSLVIGQPSPLLKEIAPAVKNHPSTMVADEGYNALDPLNQTPAVAAALVPVMLDVLAARAEQYKKGVPDEVGVDGKPVFALTRKNIWDAMQPAQRLSAMQSTSNMLELISQHAQKPDSKEQLPALGAQVKYCAQCLNFMPPANGNAAFAAALAPAMNLPPVPSAADIQQAVKPIHDAIKALDGLKDLQPAPALANAEH